MFVEVLIELLVIGQLISKLMAAAKRISRSCEPADGCLLGGAALIYVVGGGCGLPIGANAPTISVAYGSSMVSASHNTYNIYCLHVRCGAHPFTSFATLMGELGGCPT